MICPCCSKEITPIPFELKATYMSSTKPIEDSVNYARQVMAQCYVTKTTQAKLSKLCLLGNWKWVYHPSKPETIAALVAEFGANWADHPTLHAWSFEFTQAELDKFWDWMKQRRDLYQVVLDTGVLLPKAITVAKGQEFECNDCAYSVRCK